MSKIKITLSDGTQKEYPKGISVQDIVQDINPKLAKEALVAAVDGQLVDLVKKLDKDCQLSIFTFQDPQGKYVYWHSTAHIMAQAVQELFPGTKLAIGPPIEEGFYYDFDKSSPFEPEDLEKIEKRMQEIVAENSPFQREELPSQKAFEFLKNRKEDYKLEIIRDLNLQSVSLYKHSRFVDLCMGPHVPHTGKIKAFKLLSIAGAYWRGIETNPMLQRIYGVSYPSQAELEDFLKRLEDAKKNDHRKLGKELELFSFQEEAGPGLVFWHPKGALIRKIIEDFMKDLLLKSGYDLVNTPHIAKINLWETSGHTQFYRENMYPTMDLPEASYQLKPMNCPFHILIFRSKLRSYRDLPIRMAEYGTVYRYERAGVLHGLPRVRGFTQDDAHIFCRPEQMQAEIFKLLELTKLVMQTFGFQDYVINLSTRPQKFIGEVSDWGMATLALKNALDEFKLPYQIAEGEGAFYGPKIDLSIKDALKRTWQCTTIQVDFNLPQRFDLNFVGPDGKFYRPIMIHRAIFGSLERFFGILIEHYGGAFPLWLSPVQLVILPITDAQLEFAQKLKEQLQQQNLRVKVDERNEKINAKIRDAEVEKIPYMFIIGKKEIENKKVSVRRHGKGDLGVFDLDEIIKRIQIEIEEKINN
ncbi:MAG TPA: threonine--tRNA ligase [candidate division Zixibacteria bacterium]|nr:threonine--tRNA ligase [candidate division Zixibacteria bacterium]